MESHIAQLDGSRRIQLVGIEVRVRVNAGDTGGTLSVLEEVLPRGCGTPLHSTPEDKVLVVMDGLIDLRLGDTEHHLGPGDSAIIPRGVLYRFSNTRGDSARVVLSLLPAGHERFLVELAGLEARGALTPASMSELGARFGVLFVDDGR